MSDSGSLSLSSLLLFAGIAFVLIRYFLGGSSQTNNGGSSARARGAGPRVNIAAVEQIAAMFPQLDRRAIAWDLQRNGGNPQASVERMLTRGNLETPPPSFQPQGLQPAQAAGAPGISNAKKPSKPLPQDLITRYRLAEKLAAQQEQTDGQMADSQEPGTATGKAKSSGWSQNRGERTNMLQQRREAMILAARRKMEEKDRRDAKGKGKEVVDTAEA